MFNNHSFANIGKSTLINILGPRKNDTVDEIIGYTSEINRSVSGCESCTPYIYSAALPDNEQLKDELDFACDRCEHKCYIQKPVIKRKYLSEKSKYSIFETKRLPKNALLLFILLHYCCDSSGIIRNISVKELADKLECTSRTILNSLHSLCTDQYIYLSLQKHGRYSHATIAIVNYKSYFLSSWEGGRGYLVLDTDILNELISLKSVIALRIYLRALLKIDDAYLKNEHTGELLLDYNYKDLCSCLPRYCKPNVLKHTCRKYITSKSRLINFVETDRGFRLAMNHSPKKIRKALLEDFSKRIDLHIRNFNADMDLIRLKDFPMEKSEYYDFLVGVDFENVPYVQLTSKDTKDLSLLMLQYEPYYIRQALIFVYKDYYVHRKPINNLGGLVRTIIQDIGFDIISKVS